jgi:hypothetical protein
VAKAAVVEEEAAEEGGLRSRMYLHEGLVEYINETYDINLDELTAAEIVAWAFAKRNEWRKTDGYAELKAEHAAEEPEEAPPVKKAAAKKAPAKKAAAAKKAPAVKKATRARAAAASDEENPFE